MDVEGLIRSESVELQKKASDKVEEQLESDTREAVQVGLVDRRVHQRRCRHGISLSRPARRGVISRYAIRPPWRVSLSSSYWHRMNMSS